VPAKKIDGGWNDFAGCGPRFLHGIQGDNGSKGYVVEKRHTVAGTGWNRIFGRSLWGGNDIPVAHILEKE